MQVSIKWLKDYIDFTESPEELADKLTMAGIPVENVLRADEGLDKVVTGRIAKLEKHADSDHLQICTMEVGGQDNIIIVTGAQNVAAGQIVPVAMVGAHLPNGVKISKGKLRGVVSMGMLCSAGELNLDQSQLTAEQLNGIYILPEDTPIGVPVKDVLGLDDVVLEFELTANRGDCFSVFGLVREIAVLTGNRPRFPEFTLQTEVKEESSELMQVSVEAEDLCDRFSAKVLRQVKIAPSPLWMQERLKGAGIRAINNVVDVTNFVMVELGQPMHAYDYDKLDGHVLCARRAMPGEELHTLDDSSRKAVGGELVIADANKAAGLAGVMGGLETEVTDTTTTVVLEAASFNGPSIRRTSRSCGLRSEASGRFERGVDVTSTPRALLRAAQLLQEMGAAIPCSGIVDAYPVPKESVTVSFTQEAVNQRLGTDIDGAVMASILEKLGFAVQTMEDGSFQVQVPPWRNDVSRMADISEEIARIYGFDNIKSSLPSGAVMQGVQSAEQDFIARMKEILVRLGLNETVSFSFTNEAILDKMNVPADSSLRQAIPIMNPLSDEYPLVRTSLLANVFENTIRNLSRKNTDVRIFEIAPVFFPKALPVTEQPEEVLQAAGLITGRRQPQGWNTAADSVDFYDMKAIMEDLFTELGVTKYEVISGSHFAMHPGKTAIFRKGKEDLAVMGEVHPAVAEAFGFTQDMYIFTLDVTVLQKYAKIKFKYQPLQKYPSIARDLAMLVDEGISAGEIEHTIQKNAGKYLESLCLFDVYTGKQIADGKKSLAFSLQFRAANKTLTDEEADSAFQNVLRAVEKEFAAELRS